MTKENWAKGLACILSSHTKLDKPNKETSDMWFSWLSDIPDEVFIKTCEDICKKTGYPPQNLVGEIHETAKRTAMEMSGQLKPEQAYQIIEDAFEAFYDPYLSSSAWVAIRGRLESRGYGYLVPMAQRWGVEIWSKSNLTATRAQFIKSYKPQLEIIDKQIESGKGEFKKLQMPNVVKLKSQDN